MTRIERARNLLLKAQKTKNYLEKRNKNTYCLLTAINFKIELYQELLNNYELLQKVMPANENK